MLPEACESGEEIGAGPRRGGGKRYAVTSEGFRFPKFFVTVASPCPYLPGRYERKLFTELSGEDAMLLHDTLARVGFRRSQRIAYRPACDSCSACLSVRIPVDDYVFTRRDRRILRRNADLEAAIEPPMATGEQFALLKRYLAARHADGDMVRMRYPEYREMVENTPIVTEVISWRPRGGRERPLLAVSITDVMDDGLSMVYSFYEPTAGRRSLGRFMILEHIRRARAQGLAHVYLGYWVENSPKMAYKATFRPLEVLIGQDWQRMDDIAEERTASDER